MTESLLATVRDRVGSRREAIWIVERVESMQLDAEAASQEALALAERRAAGEPLQYVLGTWLFRALSLIVTPAALIPRPETEQLVEQALQRWRALRPGEGALRIVDLGTGTGAIGLSLAAELGGETTLELWLTDRSPTALELAAANAESLGIAAHLREGSWFEALDPSMAGTIHLLVSNPPYVAEGDRPTLDPVLAFEPDSALFSADGSQGTPGFGDLELLISEAPRWLASGGILAFEMAESHVEPARALGMQVGLTEIEPFADLAGKPRGIVAVAP